jgi:hypothetical protein
MFLRVVRATVSKGVKREYVRLVEAYRDPAGKTQHRTVLNLGRKDLLAAHLDLTKLRRLLHGEEKTNCLKREDVGAIGLGLGPDAGGASDVARARPRHDAQ